MPTEKVTLEELAEMRARGLSWTQISKEIGINPRTIQRRMDNAAKRGYLPQMQIKTDLPEFLRVKGTSQLIDNRTGEPVMSWVKTTTDHEALSRMIQEGIEAMNVDIRKWQPIKPSGNWTDSLMCVYPIGDAHIGMRAWGKETQGDDWDLEIGERVQCAAMDALVAAAPASEKAVIVNLGDWFHADNIEGVTSRSGHNLDTDGRYGRVIPTGIITMRRLIDSALAKHKTVHVINASGNHDDLGCLWLRNVLAVAYEKEPRVVIDESPAAFHYIEHGKCLVGVHHGHSCKFERLPGVMAADQHEAWGRTKHRYWYVGHVHHQSVKEYAGVSVETFNTLTAKDAYAAFGGYRARQNMKCIVLHSEHGEVARHTVHPEMLA